MALEKVLVEDFEILNNGEGFAIAFQLDSGMIFDADFVYDGRNCAILTRNKEKAFLFTNILPALRDKLAASDKIVIFEEKGKEVANAYEVEVRHVDNIPYPDNFEKDSEQLIEQLKNDMGEEEFEKLMAEIAKEYKKTQK